MNSHHISATSTSILLIKPKCPLIVHEKAINFHEQIKQSKISCDVILLPEIPISTYYSSPGNHYKNGNNHSYKNNGGYDDNNNIITYHKQMNPCDIDTSWIIPFNDNSNGSNKFIASFSNCKAAIMHVKHFSNNNVVTSTVPVEMNPSTFHFELSSSTKEQPLRLEMYLEVLDWGSIGGFDYHESPSSSSMQPYQKQNANSFKSPNMVVNGNNNDSAIQLQQMLHQETKNLYYILTILGIALGSVYIFATHKLLQKPKQSNNNKTSPSLSSSSAERHNYSSNRSLCTHKTLATKRTSCSTRMTSTGRSRRRHCGIRSKASRRHSSKYNTSSPEDTYDDDNSFDYNSHSSFSYSTIVTSKGPATIVAPGNGKSVCSKRSNCSNRSYYTNSKTRNNTNQVPIHMIHLDNNNMMIKEEDEYCGSSVEGERTAQKQVFPTVMNNNQTTSQQTSFQSNNYQQYPSLSRQNDVHYNNTSRLMTNNMNAFATATQGYNNTNNNNISTPFSCLPTTNGQQSSQLLGNFHLGVNTSSTCPDFTKRKQQSPFLVSQCNNNSYQRHQQKLYHNAINLQSTEQQIFQSNNQQLSTPLPSFNGNNDSNSVFSKTSLKDSNNSTAPLSPCSKLVHQFKMTKSLRRKKFLMQKKQQHTSQEETKNSNNGNTSNVITPEKIDICDNNTNKMVNDDPSTKSANITQRKEVLKPEVEVTTLNSSTPPLALSSKLNIVTQEKSSNNTSNTNATSGTNNITFCTKNDANSKENNNDKEVLGKNEEIENKVSKTSEKDTMGKSTSVLSCHKNQETLKKVKGPSSKKSFAVSPTSGIKMDIVKTNIAKFSGTIKNSK